VPEADLDGHSRRHGHPHGLTDHTKTRRKLSELQGIDPMILVLSRGGFCPKDHRQHLELTANYPKIRIGYAQIVTISTDNILKTNEFRGSVGAQWTFLSDAGHKIAKDLGIAEYTDPHYDPMIPYTLVLKPGLVIHSVYNGYWFWGRPSFEDLRRDLREVTTRRRPSCAAAMRPGGRSRFCSGGLLPWCQVAVPGLDQAVKAVAEQAGREQRQQPRTVLCASHRAEDRV